MASRKAEALVRDMREARPSAEQIAGALLSEMSDHDPVEAVCALAMVASHFIVTVATEGHASISGHERLQAGVQSKLLDRVTELCQEARIHGAN